MVTRLSGRILSKGITSNGIAAMQCERLVLYEIELESLPPEKAHTTQPKQRERSTEKPTRIESIRNILTCPVMTHIGKLRKKHISHPRKGGGVTGSKWCFPEPSRCISRARPQAATICRRSQPLQQPASPGHPCHKGSLCLSSVPVHHPQPSSFSKGGQPPWQYDTCLPQLSPVQVALTMY